jgi:hypothetical protein
LNFSIYFLIKTVYNYFNKKLKGFMPMKCPVCGNIDSKVLEVREIRKGSSNLCLVLDDYLERRPSAD